ncbi:PH domain-containing protein [Stieleria varia]|uniref:Uncharacterized protein YyaB-like PH domain-containing protein n=1 Tax=Stieleria varia TaxID=2528005 RepID=A0A5C6AYT6_9BACT|nr:PH domain-containing protein [Stieleria varia]TWU04637.1 hypothetical protein Pla52n_26790 [Stieleria varia]
MTQTNHRTNQVYESAVDWWVWPVLLAAPLICLGSAGLLLSQGKTQDAITVLFVGTGSILLTGMFTVPCRYTILSDSLTIRCGILFYRVPFEKIQSVELSGSWLSGPALSLRRVKVSTPSRFHLVSPKDRELFIEHLNSAIANFQAKSRS